ncbi:carboxypeptidase B-like isoform X5 [Acipenser ruthenus]|uniref:carboxypeptidase B-like isoform X5 n=1 Tax=Acipenser ruthenus TaxID=7906 RepID=UPI0027408619|nr:carboxypeptidase B-like isoform X5 [Acipenser ruthenus]
MLELVFLVVFCLLVAVQPTWSELRFEGAKVFRMKPNTEEQAVFIKHLAQKVMMDFWFPESVNQVAQGMTADIHIGGDSVLYVENHLKYSGIDHSIFIDNLQDQIKSQFDRVLRSAEVYDYEKYNDWDKIVSWTEHIAATFPSLVTRTEIGKTFEGNPIYLLKVGSRQDQSKPAVFMDCGIHAREWISPAFCQWFVKEATNTYGSDNLMTTLLDNLVFYVVPVLNVDGYIYTWTNDRLWRKNRSKHPSSSCLGVDLNRNFDAGWCKLGSSKNPCDETFCGSEVESELETLLLEFPKTGPMIMGLSIPLPLNSGTSGAMVSSYQSLRSVQLVKKLCWQSNILLNIFWITLIDQIKRWNVYWLFCIMY